MSTQEPDFERVRLLGVEYACSSGKAVACLWDPAPEQQETAEIHEVVAVAGKKYTVEMFANGIFSKSMIQSIFIPNTVMFLPDKCFEFCENLVKVTFGPESQIDSFGKACFKHCGLSEIDVPDRCTSIGAKCFDGCHHLQSVRISEKSQLTTIGEFAFRGCHVSNLYLPSDLVIERTGLDEGVFVGVNSVAVALDNPTMVLRGDLLLSKDGKELISCFSSESICEVPDSVRDIWKWCFAGSKVRKVVFGINSKISGLCGAFGGSDVEEIVFEQGTVNNYLIKNGMLLQFYDQGFQLSFRLDRKELMELGSQVKNLDNRCFRHSEPLKIVRFDHGCRDVEIGTAAFKDMGIVEVAIHGWTTVPKQCFYRCRFCYQQRYRGKCPGLNKGAFKGLKRLV